MTATTHTRFRLLLTACAAAVCLLVARGCAQQAAAPRILRAWPKPPAPPRIVLRRVITGAKDFERSGFFEGLARLITGGRKQVLLRPQDVAVDSDQRIYVADQEHQGVHVFDPKSGKSRFLDRAGDVYFVSPAGVAVVENLVAVSDSVLNQVFLLTPEGDLKRTIGAPGGFGRPTGLAYDAARRRLYVVDTLANEVWLFDGAGQPIRSIGRRGTEEGQFNSPTYVAVDAAGRVYVTDSMNFRVQIFDADGRFLRAIGKLGDATGYMAVPKGVALDTHGHLYVADSYLATVQVFDLEGRLLLAFGERGDEAGSFQVPTGVAVGPGDRIYVCDGYSRRLQVFQYMEPNDEQVDTP